jgi:replicative DNA helicase
VHEEIYCAILGLRKARQPVDHVTLGDALRAGCLPQLLEPALRLLPDLATHPVVPEAVEVHAKIVRSCAIRRRLVDLGTSVRQRAFAPEADVLGLPQEFARAFAQVGASASDDVATRSLGDLMASEDPPYDWIVPGLLERQDRLILTGYEGLGKSTVLRQIGVLPAAGMHPFRPGQAVPKIKTHFFDFENTETHVRRKMRGLFAAARQIGDDPSARVSFDFRPRGVNLLRDRDLSWMHRSLDASNPDLVIVGPLYRMFGKAINSDEDAAEVFEVLDGIRERGVAIVVEAHSGHTKSATGKRDVRPRGSSALMGWPEFGYGLRPHREVRNGVELVDWRGDRDDRDWPRELGRGGRYPWTDMRHHANYDREEAA